jgi:hypothetical protein
MDTRTADQINPAQAEPPRRGHDAAYWLGEKGLERLKRQFLRHWNGDTEATAKTTGIPLIVCKDWVGSDWFAEELARMAAGLPEEKIVRDHTRMLRTDPADRAELLAFWTRVMSDNKVDLDTRLKASKMLADAQGVQAPQKVELTGAEGGAIQIEKTSLAERVAMLAVKAQAKGEALPDFLA